jgi:ribonuclease HII
MVIGIDEAGYGPLLGPLVVTATAFEVPDDAMEDCLWRRLGASVANKVSKRDHRVPIVDSKKLFNQRIGVAALERSVLAMAKTVYADTASLSSLLCSVSPNSIADGIACPWYDDSPVDLPVANDVRTIDLLANSVRRDMNERGVRLTCIDCEIIREPEYNRLVNATRNKSTALLGIVFRLMDRAMTSSDSERFRILVDRQGGRSRYGPKLMTNFENHNLTILEESDDVSRYRLTSGRSVVEVEFAKSSEDKHMPVALASMISKYVRELSMASFNRFWRSIVSDIEPTAGYYQDAKRFLSDLGDAVEKAGVKRDDMIRVK